MDTMSLSYFAFTVFVLWAAHCIGDYPLQGEFLARYKAESLFVLVCHSIIYTATVMGGFYVLYATGYYLQSWNLTSFCSVSYFILLTHIMIDAVKCEYRKYLQIKYPDLNDSNSTGHKYDVRGFYLDQLAHAIVLLSALFMGAIVYK